MIHPVELQRGVFWMRRIYIAGNWKMNKDHAEGAEFAEEFVSLMGNGSFSFKVVIFPPFTTIPAVMSVFGNGMVEVGGQDIFYEDEGAFTGEISGKMLGALGCRYALVGHSERRHIIGEKGEILAKKVRAALRNDLTPVFCVGEMLEEREGGKAKDVVREQLAEGLEGLSEEDASKIVLAYEPVWAIGTGKTATPEDAKEMHTHIRSVIAESFSPHLAEGMSILYGGSVKPTNAAELLSEDEIDGVLVGGASLDASTFYEIVKAAR